MCLAIATAYLRFPPAAPYVGAGWANLDDPDRRGLNYSIDLGLMDLGRPRVDLALNGRLVDAIEPYFRAELQALVAEKRKEVEEKLARYRYYPVVSFGVGYRF